MKSLGFAVLCVTMLLMESCVSMNRQTGGVPHHSSAYAAGSACGGAISSLYRQYRKDGTLDLSNPTNIYYLAVLAKNSSDLKRKMKDRDYYDAFTKGTFAGSQRLISQAIMRKMVSSLAGSDLSAFRRKASPVGEQAVHTVSSVVTLLNMLKD